MITKNSRIQILDVIRGFAIVSIMLLHNIEHFDVYYFPDQLPSWMVPLDKLIWDSLFFMFGGKSYAIFALMFGVTFAIQLTNQEQRGKPFRARFAWRLLLLFGFGLLNSAFFQGDILIIPGGKMPPVSSQTPLIPIADSYFTYPCEGIISQGLHLFNAIDIANECGSLVIAPAGGTVLKVKSGWNMGAGNYLTILHLNGVITVYYHLSIIRVEPGQKVNSGEIIGFMGNTGRTTGCHLHFEVRNAQNFLSKYPVGTLLKWGAK